MTYRQNTEFELAMPERGAMKWIDTSKPLGLILPVGLSLAVGMLCAVVPWWMAVGLLAGSAVMALIVIYPLAGIVLTMMLAFQAIPSSLAPDIPLGIFKLKPYELVFLWTIGAYVARMLAYRNDARIEIPAFTIPILFMLFWAVVGVVYGKYFANNGSMVLAEARGFLGLLVVPVVQLLVRDDRDIRTLSFWISAVGVLLSIYILLQATTGVRILDGRLESLDRGANSDIARTVVPGIAVQAFALYYLTLSLKNGRRFRFWLLPLILMVLLGLLGTFGRGAWMTVTLGGLVVAYLAGRWRGLFIAMCLGGVMVSATVATAYVLKPRVAEAAVERALGIGHELTTGGSWGWRKRENETAIEVIKERPFLGVGIGGVYKQLGVAEDPAFDMEAQFIHNSYLYFPLKMGVIAGLGPILIGVTFLLILGRISRQTPGRMEPAVAACSGVVALTFVGAVSSPILKSFPGLLSLGVALAICAVAYRQTQIPLKAQARGVKQGGDENWAALTPAGRLT
jgi:O-antigen ligase